MLREDGSKVRVIDFCRISPQQVAASAVGEDPAADYVGHHDRRFQGVEQCQQLSHLTYLRHQKLFLVGHQDRAVGRIGFPVAFLTQIDLHCPLWRLPLFKVNLVFLDALPRSPSAENTAKKSVFFNLLRAAPKWLKAVLQ